MDGVDSGNNSAWILPVSITCGVVLVLLLMVIIYLFKTKKIRLDFFKKLGAKKSKKLAKENAYDKFLDISEKKIKDEFTRVSQESLNYKGSTEQAQKSKNLKKNRYKNILPYDATRVKLEVAIGEDPEEDYINASYIKGYSGKFEFIAAQGPMSNTCHHFWKMIVSEKINLIVMVSNFVENGSNKCYKYVPDVDEEQIEDDFCVKCLSENVHDSFRVKKLELNGPNAKIEVTHMQYLNWPDFGVPDNTDSMLAFREEMRKLHKSGPILIHCSAGVGRTGTLIALDIAIQTINDQKPVKIDEIILEMRKQRPLMIQTDAQCIFLYKCLGDYLRKNKTSTLVRNK